MEKSVKSLLFNLLVPFVQWEGAGSIEGAGRKSGRSEEEENQNTKFSAWVVFSKWNLKSSETQWSPLFPPLCYVCVNIHRRLVGGWLPFQECPAVDVFGICGPCCSIVRSPQQLNLGAACDPCGCLYFFFSSPSSFSRSVGGWSEIKNRNYVWLLLHPDLPSEISLS